MPAAPASEELKEKVKVVALQIGVREAARQFGLDEERVLKWSARGNWFGHKDLVAESVAKFQEKQQVSSAVLKSPSDIISAFGSKTKLVQAKVVHKTAKAFSKKDGESLILLTKAVKDNVDSADKLFGYSAPAQSLTQVNINLSNTQLPER